MKRKVIARGAWWRIVGLGANEAELLIYGDIGENWNGDGITGQMIAEQLAQVKAARIYVRINSFGGSIADGIAIYNALKRNDAEIVTCNDFIAASVSSLILMAGDRVEMSDNALLMVHAPWAAIAGNAVDLRDQADVLDRHAASMATCYAAKTGKPMDEMLSLLTDGKDHWYSAAEAKDAGFVDQVVASVSQETNPDSTTAAFPRQSFDLSRFKPPAAVLAALRTRYPAAAAASNRNEEIPMNWKAIAAALGIKLARGSDDNAAKAKVLEKLKLAAEATDEQVQAALDTRAGEPDPATNPNPAPNPAPANGETPAQAQARLQQRNTDISQAFAAFRTRAGVADLERECLVDASLTAEQARAKLLAKLGEGAAPAGGAVQPGVDARDKFRAGVTAALMVRGGLQKPDPKVMEGNEFRGMTLMELARASLRLARGSEPRGDKLDIVAQAFTYTGSDFPVLLQNIAEKSMLKGYQETPETFQLWTTPGTLPDFKQALRVDVTQFPSLDKIQDGAEFKVAKGIGDRGEFIQLATFGKLFSITRQTVINDDLNALTRIPMYMGRAAIRTVGDLVYLVAIGGNPAMRDGNALFFDRSGAGGVNNIMTPAAILTASVDAMRVSMAVAKENGATLGIRLKNLLVPEALAGQARVVRDSQFQVDAITSAKGSQNTIPNSVRGIFEVIPEARLDSLSATAWYGTADPTINDTVEVAYLDGNPLPFLDQQIGWTVDGTAFKVRIDAGVSALDSRTLRKNAGA